MSSSAAGFSTVNRFAVLEEHQPKSKSKKQTGSDGDTSVKQGQGRENGKVDVGVNGNAKVNGTSNGNGNGKKQDHASQRSSNNTQTVDSQTRSTTVNGKTPHSTSTSKPSVPTAYLKTPAKKSSKSNNTHQKPTDTFDQDQDQAQMRVNGLTQQMKHLTKDLSKKEPEVREVKERVGQKKKKTDWEVPRKTLHGSIGKLLRLEVLFTTIIHVSILMRHDLFLAFASPYRLPSPVPPLPNPPHPPTPAHHSNNSPDHHNLYRRTPVQLSFLQQTLYQSLRAIDEKRRGSRVERRDLVSYWGGCDSGGLS
jgi:hypothetical protein